MAVLYASISVLNLMRAATGSQSGEIKRGPFGFAEDHMTHYLENEH